ncbi:MAG: hypothetical protein V7459_12980 [Oceanicoccus sp.]
MNILTKILYQMRAVAVIGWIALLSGQLSALEVSELRLHSHLGEPLLAELQLSSHDSFDPQNLMIKLAPAEIYQKMDVDVPSLYLDIKFEMDANGLVKITTRDPVKEPYLNFILQFRWPAGELYKEFSVLLDPK